MIEKYHLIFEIIYWMLFQFWKFYFNNYIQSVTFINNNSIYLRNELHIFSKICTSSNNEFVCELRNYATCRSRITFGITLINWTFRQTCIWNAPLEFAPILIEFKMIKNTNNGNWIVNCFISVHYLFHVKSNLIFTNWCILNDNFLCRWKLLIGVQNMKKKKSDKFESGFNGKLIHTIKAKRVPSLSVWMKNECTFFKKNLI